MEKLIISDGGGVLFAMKLDLKKEGQVQPCA